MGSFRSACFTSFSLIFLLHCSHIKEKKSTRRAYYFWRFNTPSPNEYEFLKAHNVQKLYVHLMDVDWSPVYGPIPVSSNDRLNISYDLKTDHHFSAEFVPVVFITNRTFEIIDSSDMPQLAKRIVRRCLPAFDSVDQAYEQRTFQGRISRIERPKEIQFDCDWTERTKGKYFSFLREVQHLLPSDSIIVSATIRLHQYRYFKKTGVPPVQRGMLMLYNISNPKQYSNNNSIFEEHKVRAYLTSNNYPLPLDFALPAWSWCIVFRNKNFYQVENGLDEGELKSLGFLQSEGNHFYRLTEDTVYRDLFLRAGDEIKAESINEQQLMVAAKLARKAANTDLFTVSLFELSENEYQHYSHETIDQVFSSF